jgi:hypothetical protein
MESNRLNFYKTTMNKKNKRSDEKIKKGHVGDGLWS